MSDLLDIGVQLFKYFVKVAAVLILFYGAFDTWYSSHEAHNHIHEAINACSGGPVFADNGERIND